METAEKLCTEIFLMNKGKEVTSGKLSDIKKNFGGNHIEIKFNGDVSFLSSMKEVVSFDKFNHYAEIQLEENIEPHYFLKQIIDKIDVTHFSVIEPTLNRIFIDLINRN